MKTFFGSRFLSGFGLVHSDIPASSCSASYGNCHFLWWFLCMGSGIHQPGRSFRPLRSNRTGQSNRIAARYRNQPCRERLKWKTLQICLFRLKLTQRILLHWFPGSFRLVQADRTAGGIENPWVCPLPRRGSLVSFPQFSNIPWLTWPKRGRPLKHLKTRCIHHDAILLCWNLCIALFRYPVVRKGQLWAMCLSNINQYSLFCMSEDLQSQFPNTWLPSGNLT